jgi:adenine-specific DNA-methyltransferase
MTDKTTLLHKINQLEGLNPEDKTALIALLDEGKDQPGLTKEEVAEYYKLRSEKKKYGLVWEDKPEEVERLLLNNLPVLTEVKERYIAAKPTKQGEPISTNKKGNDAQLVMELETENSKNQPKPANSDSDQAPPHHILIEGDNLHALTALSFTHKEKIDVIYIDPPYNTGNKDFKYNDSFVDKEDSYRHSKWLSFMHKRLVLAKALLKDTGVIFISIDDNEQAQLKLLCDSVFGESKFFGNFIWNTRTGAMDSVNNLSTDHEFICVFGKQEGRLSGIKRTFEKYKNPDNDPRGPWIADNLSASKPGGNTYYGIKHPEFGTELFPPKGRYWPYNPESMEQKVKEGRIIFPKEPNGSPLLKRFQFEAKFDVLPVSSILRSDKSKELGNSLIVDYTSGGTRELQAIFDEKVFRNPKPSILIKQLINQKASINSIILDFFAGSGTALNAVLNLNAEDGGNRQCILVTNNENNIAEEVCYERNKRVINGFTKPNGEYVEGLTNNHLHYFKAEMEPFAHDQASRIKLVAASTGLLQIKENCFTERTQVEGFEECKVRLFEGKPGWFTMVIYHHRTMGNTLELVKNWILGQDSLLARIRIYAFAPSQDSLAFEFNELANRVDVVPLPEAIYNAYRNSFKAIDLGKKDFSKLDKNDPADALGELDFEPKD